MPLPKPRRRESQDDFIGRCMSSEIMQRDFPGQQQRSAVCFSQWEERTDNMKLYELQANVVSGYEPRYEMRMGRQHIVAPVIMLIEGVHNGTAGAIFYPVDELKDFPGSWDGRPVTLGHPQHDDDMVSASSPEMMDEYNLGVLFNTVYDPEIRGLRSEIWVDVERARRLAPEVLATLQAGEPLEVSTGLWFEQSGGEGIWNGEHFTTTARDFRPDHLALLPGAVGACSMADGCGVRANAEDKEGEDMSENKFIKFVKGYLSTEESKTDVVAANMETFATNKPGMLVTIRALQQQLDGLDKDMPGGALLHFLEDAWPDGSFVMRVNGPDGTSFFRGEFNTDDNGVVELGSVFTEVREEREFVELEGNKKTTQTEKEDTNMAAKKDVVSALIGCDKTHFTEDHREFLMGLEESVLESLKPVNPPAGNKAGEATEDKSSEADNTPEADADGKGEAAADATDGEQEGEEKKGEGEGDEEPTVLEAYVSDAPEEIRKALHEAVKTVENKRQELIKSVLDVEGNKFSDEQLQGKDIEELEALSMLVSSGKGEEKTPADNEGQIDLGDPMGRVITNYSGRPAANMDADNKENDSPPMGRSGITDQILKH